MIPLVTGDQGFIGTHLSEFLPYFYYGFDLKNGHNILASPRIEEVDIVVHLAAQPGVIASMEHPEETMQTNVQGTVRMCEQYRDARFVFASSGGTIQETIASPYGLSKKMGEDYLNLRHPDAVILRFGNVYGPGSRSVVDKFLLEPKPVIYGDGSATRTYVHVSDIVQGILAAIEWPAGTYYLGHEDENFSVQEIAEMVGKTPRYEDWRPGELRESSLANTTPDWKPRVKLFDYIREQRA